MKDYIDVVPVGESAEIVVRNPDPDNEFWQEMTIGKYKTIDMACLIRTRLYKAAEYLVGEAPLKELFGGYAPDAQAIKERLEAEYNKGFSDGKDTLYDE